MMHHVPGLAASPLVRYILKWEGRKLSFRCSFWTDNPLQSSGAIPVLLEQRRPGGESSLVEQQTLLQASRELNH
jgi:hypothetical protein